MSTKDNIRTVYAIIGSDRFLRNEAVGALLRRFDAGDDSLGPTTVDGVDANLAEVLDEVRTLSLLGDRRIVIIDSADPFITTHRKKLEEYCAAPSPTGTLILACNTMAKNTRLYKVINETGAVIVCEVMKGRQVIGWVINRARSVHNRTVSPPTAARLREHVGDDPGTLDSELAKLSVYVGDRPEITPADVDALIGQHREEVVFAVTDAMSSGDPAGALTHWEQVLATDKAAPGRAIAGMAWAIRRLLSARHDFDNGVPIGNLARRVYTDPQVLERRLGRLTTENLERQLCDLCAADLAVKTGGSTLELAIEKFVVTHSRRATQSVGRR